MRTSIRFDGVPLETMREILAAASRERHGFTQHNHAALHGVEPWEPTVRCEGPSHFTVTLPPCSPATARIIIDAATA